MSGIHLNNNPFGKSGIVSKKDENFVKNLQSKEKEEMHHAKSGSSFPPEKQELKERCVIKKKETQELSEGSLRNDIYCKGNSTFTITRQEARILISNLSKAEKVTLYELLLAILHNL